MSSKLVRKGLDLVNSEGGPKPQKRKSIQKEKQSSKQRKRNSVSSKEKQQPRGLQQGLRLSSGIHKETDINKLRMSRDSGTSKGITWEYF